MGKGGIPIVTLTRNEDGTYQMDNGNGFEVKGVTSKLADTGFTPFQLICSSVSLCMAISIEALLERDALQVDGVTIKTEAVKAEDSPSRIERFIVDVQIQGNMDEGVKQKLVKSAERACTIGNTINRGAEIEINAN